MGYYRITENFTIRSNYVYSYQLDKSQETSFNPIGGIRIANITTNNLEIGFQIRDEILKLINLKKIYRYAKIIIYIIAILIVFQYFY